MSCNEAVYFALILLFIEFYLKFQTESTYNYTQAELPHVKFNQQFRILYIVFMVLALFMATLNYFKYFQNTFLNQSYFTDKIAYFYALDSFAALGLGYEMYHENFVGCIFYMIILSNLFLLFIVNRIFAPTKNRDSLVSIQ